MTGDAQRAALLEALVDHGVALVLIGGAAIQSHGLRLDTQDIDVTPDTSPANLERLARARRRPAAGTQVVVSVAALEDVHESKRQANRPKDREYLRTADL